MKNLFYIRIPLLAFLVVWLYSCEDLPILEDCRIETEIVIDPVSDCSIPCSKTFRVQDPQLLPEGAKYHWEISRENVVVDIGADAAKSEFVHEFTTGGDYRVRVDISFSFEGCDFSQSRAFQIGVDDPVAVINVDMTECVVGECEITFTSNSSNADTWTWNFPDDTNDYEGQVSVVKSFNDYPDTFRVVLTASNLSGTDTDEVDIFVEPQTFILNQAVPELENAFCITEKADGSFGGIGNNHEKTASFSLDRGGASLDIISAFSLPNGFSNPTVFDCEKIEDKFLAVGSTTRDDSNNQYVYLAAFRDDFLGEKVTKFSTGLDAHNEGFGITKRLGGGYIICGSVSNRVGIPSPDPNDEGMLFVGIDISFENPQMRILFPGSPFNRAFGMITMEDHYVVFGMVMDDDGTLKGCYFSLSQDMETISDITYLNDFFPKKVLKIDNQNFVLIGESGHTGKVMLVGDNNGSRSFGNERFNDAIVTTKNKLALVGFTDNTTSDKPIIRILRLPSLEDEFASNNPFDISGGRLLSIAETADNGFIMGGEVFVDNNNKHILIIRTNKNKTIQ